MAYVAKVKKHGIGWQHETTTPKEGEAPTATQTFLLIPTESFPSYDPGYQFMQADKFHGAPYLRDGVGLDIGRPVDAPYNPSVSWSQNIDLNLLKRLFVALTNGFGTSLGAGASGTCRRIDCPSSGFTRRYNDSVSDIYSLLYVFEGGDSSHGVYMGTCTPRRFTITCPGDGSPMTIDVELAAGYFSDGRSSGSWTFAPTTEAYHADFGGALVSLAYGGISPHVAQGFTITFEAMVEQQHNAFRNPQDLNVYGWKVTGSIGDIDHEDALFNYFQADTPQEFSIANDWDATPGNNDTENWKITLPNCRVTSQPDLAGDGRLYTNFEFEAVVSGSDNLFEFYYCDTITVWP